MNTLRKIALAAFTLLVLGLGCASAAPPQVKVTAATPSSTYQGTISLDVVVNGSGFDNTSKVQFLVSGTTNPGGVTVKKVVFHNSGEVVATIDVADTANIANFDIVVMLSDGRKGKGTTLFAVQSKTLDPCTKAGLDFPAFTYWQQSGKGQQIFVADATGKCSRPVYNKSDPMGGTVGAGTFSYPVTGTTNVGRVIWPDTSGIYGIDFTVTGTTIALGSPRSLYSGYPPNSFDLSKDGNTLYLSISPETSTDTAKVYALEISTASLTLIATGPADGSFIETLTVNGDGSALFIDLAGMNGQHRLARMDRPCGSSCTTILFTNQPGYASDTYPGVSFVNDPVLGYPLIVSSDFSGCNQLRFADFAGNVKFAGTQPRYGKRSSWYGGKVLTNGTLPPDRRGACQATGYITQVDPSTSAETQLVKGYDPDGR
jgi:hypothetical protein